MDREVSWYNGLLTRSILFFYILESLYIKSQTIVGYPGDTKYLTPDISTTLYKNFYASIEPINSPADGFPQFGKIYSQFGTNRSILSCTALNKGTADFDTVCLLGAVASAPSDFSLMTFKSEFKGKTNNRQRLEWPTQSTWQTVKLAAGKNYMLFPTDTKNELFVLASEFATATNSTTLYFGRITFNPTTKAFAVAVDWTTAPNTLANFRLEMHPYLKLCSWLTDSVLIFNPLNSTKAYDNTGQGQPGNNRIVLLHWGSRLSAKAQLVSLPIIAPAPGIPPTVTTRVPNYVMDIEAINDVIYLSAVDEEAGQPPKAVVTFLRFDSDNNQAPQFTRRENPAISLPIPPNRPQFLHFLVIQGKSELSETTVVAMHHQTPDTLEANRRNPIRVYIITPQFFRIESNDGDLFMRPLEAEAEIKVLKLGIGNFQTNIAYLIRGVLTYIDWVNFVRIEYQRASLVPKRDDKIEHIRLARIRVGDCGSAISLLNTEEDIKEAESSVTGKAWFNLLCLKDNIITMSWAGDSTIYSHIVNIPQTGTVPSFNISTYIPYALSGKTTFENPQSSRIVSATVVGSYFRPIQINSVGLIRDINPQKGAVHTIGVSADTFIGGGIAYTNQSSCDQTQFFLCRTCDMTIARDPQDTQPVTIDEVYLVTGGAIFEDTNKHAGFASCDHQIQYNTSKLVGVCKVEKFITTGQWRLSQVLDRTTACQAILFAMESKTNTSRMFYYYDLNSTSIVTVGEISNVNENVFGCTNTRMLVVGWQVGSETPTVSELVFNRVSRTRITPSTTTSGFGLKELISVRDMAMIGNDLVFTRWNNATNILEIANMTFSESQNSFSVNGLTEYRYLPTFAQLTDSVMFLSRVFIPYNKHAPQNNRILSAFWGETFRGNNKYWEQHAFNLAELGITNIIRVIPHDTRDVAMFSIWGIQTVMTGTLLTNHTILALFRVVDDPQQRLFRIFNFSKVFQEVSATSNSQDEIYYRLKEFAHKTDFVKVMTGRFTLSGRFGLSTQSSCTLTLRGTNREGSAIHNINVTFQSVSKIEVTPVKDLDYKQDLVLSLLPGMASKIVGHVTNIEMGNGTGASIRKNRFEKSTTIPDITNIPAPKSSAGNIVRSASGYGVEALLLPLDKSVHIFTKNTYLVTCDLAVATHPNLDYTKVRELSVVYNHALQQIIVIFSFQDVNQVFSLAVTSANGKPKCEGASASEAKSGPFSLDQASLVVIVPNTGSGNETFGALAVRASPSSTLVYAKATLTPPIAPETQSLVKYGFDKLEDEQPPNPAKDQKLDSIILSCFVLAPDTPERSSIQVVICFTDNSNNVPSQRKVVTVNILFAPSPAARVSILAVPSSHPLEQASAADVRNKLQCSMRPDLSISCALMDSNNKRAMNLFRFVRDTSAAGCPGGDKFFCISPANPTSKVLNFQIQMDEPLLMLSPDFIVSTIRKKDSTTTLTGFVHVVNQTESDGYFSRDITSSWSDTNRFSFFGKSNTMYLFELSPPKMIFWQVQEAEVLFTAPNLAALSAELVLRNYENSTNLKLQSLFKADAKPDPPKTPTPPPTPPKTFWQQYWWAVAGGGALLLVSGVGFYLYRREMIRSRLERDDIVTTITSLDEFHYRR